MALTLRLTAAQVRRMSELALARRLAASGLVAAARVIYARYGVSHADVEIVGKQVIA